jgi:hypothetical protein
LEVEIIKKKNKMGQNGATKKNKMAEKIKMAAKHKLSTYNPQYEIPKKSRTIRLKP